MKKFVLVMLVVLATMGFLVGCDKEEEIVPTYNMVSYHVYHYYEDVNEVYSSDAMVDEEFTIRSGTNVTITPKTVDYYTYKSSISSSSGTVYNENTSFFLYYTRNYYTISLVDALNGNTQINAKHGRAVTFPPTAYEGKILLGWSLTQDGDELVSFTTMPTQNITLYAIWQDA